MGVGVNLRSIMCIFVSKFWKKKGLGFSVWTFVPILNEESLSGIGGSGSRKGDKKSL
jgi:hypothetical protein